MEARVLGTGVELMLYDESPLAELERGRLTQRPGTPEGRAEQQRIEFGEVVLVAATGFAEIEADGDAAGRWGGSWHGRGIDITQDPTSELLDLAHEARDNGPEADVGIAGLDITRFELHAAPHRIELSERLRERLATAAWKGRPPRL